MNQPLTKNRLVSAGPEIVHLDESWFEAASQLLARAFQNDPLHSRACPDPVERARWLPYYFASFIWKSHLNGVLLGTGDPLTGVAAAIQPGGATVSDDARSRLCDQRARIAIGGDSWDKYNTTFDHIFDGVEAALEAAIPEPHWYLDMLAVDPAAQGHGIGGALLRALNDIADHGGQPVGLLTFQLDNLPFYARHGYEVVRAEVEPVSGLHWWAFRRNPLSRE